MRRPPAQTPPGGLRALARAAAGGTLLAGLLAASPGAAEEAPPATPEPAESREARLDRLRSWLATPGAPPLHTSAELRAIARALPELLAPAPEPESP